jgi:hypothetical protein
MATRRWSPVEQNFLRAVGLTVALVVAFHLLGLMERGALALPGQPLLLGEASAAAMRYVTIPHYIVAMLFLVTGSRNRTPARRALIGSLLLVGAGLCWLYYRLGGAPIPGAVGSATPGYGIVLAGLVYIYFICHELRDEAFFYGVLDRVPSGERAGHFPRFADGLVLLGGFGLLAMLWPVLVLGLPQRIPPLIGAQVALPVRAAIAALPMLVWVAAEYGYLRRHAAHGFGGVSDLVRQYGVLFRVFVGVFLVLGLGLAILGRPYPIVLLHVSAWYVFVSRTAKAAASSDMGWWTRIRTTRRGFQSLHVGLVVALGVAAAVSVYAFGALGPLWYLLSGDVFVYWTIMHLTVSSLPR